MLDASLIPQIETLQRFETELDVGKARAVVVTVVVRCRACGLLRVIGMSVHRVGPCAAAVWSAVALSLGMSRDR